MTAENNPLRITILASGAGTLAQAIMDAAGAEYTVVGVVSDVPCGAIDRAQAAGYQAVIVPRKQGQSRADWDMELRDAVAVYAPDVVVSAGFMKILGPAFLAAFPGRIINTHPALLPAFPGAHAVLDAWEYGVKVTGCTVHVVDEGVDTGPILRQEAVSVAPDDDVDTLHERIKTVERRLIVDVLRGDVSQELAALAPPQ